MLTDARSIRIKGRSFLALVLSPDLPLDDWMARLDDLASRSAGFFLDRPVVLDVTGLAIDKVQLRELFEQLAERNVRVMGIEGARPSMLGPGMPPAMKGGKPAADIEVKERESAAPRDDRDDSSPQEEDQGGIASVRPGVQSLIINEPVRSGQSIIFPEGDVTIVGSVASGAEVIAGGSIHIYGALRGRAMAGSIGNAASRIFCRKLEAELVAIDGIYKMIEDMSPTLRGQPVQLWLDGDSIMAATIN